MGFATRQPRNGLIYTPSSVVVCWKFAQALKVRPRCHYDCWSTWRAFNSEQKKLPHLQTESMANKHLFQSQWIEKAHSPLTQCVLWQQNSHHLEIAWKYNFQCDNDVSWVSLIIGKHRVCTGALMWQVYRYLVINLMESCSTWRQWR